MPYTAKDISIGFTGTGQRPLTQVQRESLQQFLKTCWELGWNTFHHGDCEHADAEAHDIAYAIGYNIVIHPPLNEYKRAFKGFISMTTVAAARVTILPAKEFIPRDHDIVDAVGRMFACPKERFEVIRSGTWATVRYARKQHVPVEIIYP